MGGPNEIKFSCPGCGREYYLGAVEKGSQERTVKCFDCPRIMLVRFSIEVTEPETTKK